MGGNAEDAIAMAVRPRRTGAARRGAPAFVGPLPGIDVVVMATLGATGGSTPAHRYTPLARVLGARVGRVAAPLGVGPKETVRSGRASPETPCWPPEARVGPLARRVEVRVGGPEGDAREGATVGGPGADAGIMVQVGLKPVPALAPASAPS